MTTTKETPPELSEDDLHGIGESFIEELKYFDKATMMRDAVWIFDSLIKEDKVSIDTEIGELIDILNQEEEVIDAFNKMTEEEPDNLKKIIKYYASALVMLNLLKEEGAIRDDSPLREAHSLLKVRLARPESRMDEEDAKKREVAPEPYEK